MTGRWQYTRQIFAADDLIIGERADQNNKQQNIGTTWTHLFSPETVGEFRYGLGLRTTLVNITAGNDTPVIRFQNPAAVAGGSIIGNAGAFPIQRYQTDHQFVYNLSTLSGGNHFFKLGTDIRRQALDDLADSFSRGFYNFSAATCNTITYGSGLNAFLNGCVSSFTKGYGPFFLENRINEYNFYGEDNWRVRPNLTLNLGLRYEYVAVPKEAENRIDYIYGDEKTTLSHGLVLRGARNSRKVFWRRFSAQPAIRRSVVDTASTTAVFSSRFFRRVVRDCALILLARSSVLLRRRQLRHLRSSTLMITRILCAASYLFRARSLSTRSYASVDPGLEMPYTQQWNLSIEREMPFNSAIRVSYTGNRGIGLLRFAQGNLPVHDPINGVFVVNHPNNAAAQRGQVIRVAADAECAGTNGLTTGTGAIPFTAACPVVVPIGTLEYSVRVPRTNERRPDPRYSTNLLVSNAAWSYYHGLQVEWTKKLSRGFNFQAAYTFSKSIDTTSEATDVGVASGDTNQTGNDSRVARGLSLFHTPHRLPFPALTNCHSSRAVVICLVRRWADGNSPR